MDYAAADYCAIHLLSEDHTQSSLVPLLQVQVNTCSCLSVYLSGSQSVHPLQPTST